MVLPEHPRLAWYLEAYHPQQHRWLTISHLSQYHHGFFQTRNHHLPVLITPGTITEWRTLLPALANLKPNQLSIALRTPWQQQSFRQTGHARGLGLHSITIAELLEALQAQPECLGLRQLWNALQYGYSDELNLTPTRDQLPQAIDPNWRQVRLVVWQHSTTASRPPQGRRNFN